MSATTNATCYCGAPAYVTPFSVECTDRGCRFYPGGPGTRPSPPKGRIMCPLCSTDNVPFWPSRGGWHYHCPKADCVANCKKSDCEFGGTP